MPAAGERQYAVPEGRRVALVRHGESTWNAEGRVQGSSDGSRLTERGRGQARAAGAGLARGCAAGGRFAALFRSPLRRAVETADIVLGELGEELPTKELKDLREIDLYSFQGLLKAEGAARHGEAWDAWLRDPAQFSIDGHFPVRELWERAGRGWVDILADGPASDDGDGRNALVVAHNAVNQALVGSALGLPPTFFRRLLQANGAVTVLDFLPTAGGAALPRVTVDRLNQPPSSPVDGPAAREWATTGGGGGGGKGRVILVRHAETLLHESGILEGCLSTAGVGGASGEDQLRRLADELAGVRLGRILSSPSLRCQETATAIASAQATGPEVCEREALRSLHLGAWEGLPAREVRGKPPPPDAEPLEAFWERTAGAWRGVLREAAEGGGRDVLVVADGALFSAFLGHCLSLGPESMGMFRFSPGSLSVLDFPDGPLGGPGVVRCTNCTTHLGPGADTVALPADVALDDVCGIDGCF